MKIIVAPNAFKGSLSGHEAALSIERGIRRTAAEAEIVRLPVADGGDGLAEILARALDGRLIATTVSGPLQTPVNASFCYLEREKTAIVEMAQASGLELVARAQRNPEETTTFGTGQLIGKCLDMGVSRIVVGLGGSATCDGGIGAAAALGYRFLDANGVELSPVGRNLIHIKSIDFSRRDPRLDKVTVEAICDVANPLFGPEGASYVYSPQKGADAAQVARLDEGLANLAAVIQEEMGIEVGTLSGAGAAGGLGAGVHAFFNGRLRKGIDLVIDLIGLKKALAGADLVITGEGCIDYQTKFDKAPAGVARAAQEAGIPCVAICGKVGQGVEELHDIGFTAIFSLCHRPLDISEALAQADTLLADTAEQVMRLFLAK